MIDNELKEFLDLKVEQFNRPGFIENDPISIPHLFTKKQDIEISGFFAAMLAWGQRVTILNNCNRLMTMMDHSPWEFVKHHSDKDLKKLAGFVHRTFNDTDLLYFISFFREFYSKHDSLEYAFLSPTGGSDQTMEQGLNNFREVFFSLEDAPLRSRKHVSSPAQKSACKRLNMYLRWMVRNDKTGVDFGIWKKLRPSQLLCPLDLHVSRTARNLGLISRKQDDWQTVLELTSRLREFDAKDPVKYDFALYGLGVIEGFNK
jgi:uncharacterized protein (TIGR02757 family)